MPVLQLTAMLDPENESELTIRPEIGRVLVTAESWSGSDRQTIRVTMHPEEARRLARELRRTADAAEIRERVRQTLESHDGT